MKMTSEKPLSTHSMKAQNLKAYFRLRLVTAPCTGEGGAEA